MSMYNFKLYEDFCDAARELNIELSSRDGGCVNLKLPNNLNKRFWAMLWTPLNKLDQMDNKDTWQRKLDHLKYNHEDFHLEFDTKDYEHGSYWMFPEVYNKPSGQITKHDIKVCVERMLDEENFAQYITWAKLQELTDDE